MREANQAAPRVSRVLADALVEDLTAHRTAVLRIELTRNPAVALAATVHALALAILYPDAAQSCLSIRASSEALERHTKAQGDSPAHRAMAEEGERRDDQIPGDEADLLAWCLAQPKEVLLDLLAFLAGLSVDAVQMKQGMVGRHDHADQLAGTLALDMARQILVDRVRALLLNLAAFGRVLYRDGDCRVRVLSWEASKLVRSVSPTLMR